MWSGSASQGGDVEVEQVPWERGGELWDAKSGVGVKTRRWEEEAQG